MCPVSLVAVVWWETRDLVQRIPGRGSVQLHGELEGRIHVLSKQKRESDSRKGEPAALAYTAAETTVIRLPV